MHGRFGQGGLLPLRLQLVVGLICLKGCGGEAVVLPPRDQRGNGGDTGGDQLLHGLALDGQDGLIAVLFPHGTRRGAARRMVPLPVLETGALST